MTAFASLPADPGSATERVAVFFEHLTPADLARLDEVYAPQAHFKDPFNDVAGVPAIRHIFEHMFANLHEPRFVVTERLAQGGGPVGQAVLVWDFHFRFKTVRPTEWQCIRGASHLRFDAQGRVTLHRDYWDAAEELYEKLPVVGGVMRWLKRRAAQ
jgi:steroid Delta-isomerase